MKKRIIAVPVFAFLMVGVLFLDSCLFKNSCDGIETSKIVLTGTYEPTVLQASVVETTHGLPLVEQQNLTSSYFNLKVALSESKIAHRGNRVGYYGMYACDPAVADSTKHINNVTKLDVIALTSVSGAFKTGDTITTFMKLQNNQWLAERNQYGYKLQRDEKFEALLRLHVPLNVKTELKFKVVAHKSNGTTLESSTVAFFVTNN